MSDDLRPPVDIEFELETSETASALRWHVLHQTGFLWRASLGVVAAGLLSVSFHLTGWSWLLASLFGASVFIVGTVLVSYVFPFAVAARSPRLTQSYELVVSHRGVRYQTGGTAGHIEWERYDTWKGGPDFFFLYYDDDQFTLIPRDRLSETRENRLRAFFEDYIGPDSA